MPRPQLLTGLPSLPDEDAARLRLVRYGADLFNHGFWWEAHEAWEAPWRTLPRHSPPARVLRGLILLAAGQLKWSQGQLRGRGRHFAHALREWELAAQNCVESWTEAARPEQEPEPPPVKWPPWLPITPPSLRSRFGLWCAREPWSASRTALMQCMPLLLLPIPEPEPASQTMETVQ